MHVEGKIKKEKRVKKRMDGYKAFNYYYYDRSIVAS